MAELDLPRRVIADFVPQEAAQERAQRHMLAFLDSHPDALHRTCLAGHLTGSALVVNAQGDKALFMLHTKLRRWLQPGGHADGDPDLAAVALKEASEETGITGLSVDPRPIDLDVHEVLTPKDAAHLHLDVRYLVRAPKGAVEQGNEESQALAWHDFAGVRALGTDDSTLRLTRLGLAAAQGSLT
jgi:8-oxo-dGTP pyrophosphatase MutT (NUDIX family)